MRGCGLFRESATGAEYVSKYVCYLQVVASAHSQKEVLVCSSTYNIGCEEEFPVEGMRVHQRVCRCELNSHHKEHYIFREWFVAHELCDLDISCMVRDSRSGVERTVSMRKALKQCCTKTHLRMSFQDCPSSRSMRLFIVHPQPVIGVLCDGWVNHGEVDRARGMNEGRDKNASVSHFYQYR